jgi:hypothetical protein
MKTMHCSALFLFILANTTFITLFKTTWSTVNFITTYFSQSCGHFLTIICNSSFVALCIHLPTARARKEFPTFLMILILKTSTTIFAKIENVQHSKSSYPKVI